MTACEPSNETETMGYFEETQMLYGQDIKKMLWLLLSLRIIPQSKSNEVAHGPIAQDDEKNQLTAPQSTAIHKHSDCCDEKARNHLK